MLGHGFEVTARNRRIFEGDQRGDEGLIGIGVAALQLTAEGEGFKKCGVELTIRGRLASFAEGDYQHTPPENVLFQDEAAGCFGESPCEERGACRVRRIQADVDQRETDMQR